MYPLQNALWMQLRKCDVDCESSLRLSRLELTLLAQIVKIVDCRFNRHGRRERTRGNNEPICELKDVFRAPAVFRAPNIHEKLVCLVLLRILCRLELASDEKVPVKNCSPIDRKAEVAVLLLLNLVDHESARLFKRIKVIPRVDKPARYLTALVPVLLEQGTERAWFLRVVGLDLIVWMELGTRLI